MHMHMLRPILLALVAALVHVRVQAATDPAATPVLLHRLFVLDGEDAPFVPRASINVALRQIVPVPHINNDLSNFYLSALTHKDALYQVALQHPGTPEPVNVFDISSVKACQLPFVSGDFLHVHIGPDGELFHADYYLPDVPPSGACPPEEQLLAVDPAQLTILHPSNTTVTIRRATHPPLPGLRTPPPLSPQGEPVPPPPEKTFIQKYWVYIMACLFLILISGAPPEEEGSQQAREN